ncbi:MAG: hypothetical protein PUF72_05425 [Clostridiales bacterium]|nr:hypothetical protein [Clostridiales bacterium]
MKIISKVVKVIQCFCLMSVGAMLAMFIEFGFAADFVISFVLALITFVCSTIQLRDWQKHVNE